MTVVLKVAMMVDTMVALMDVMMVVTMVDLKADT